MKLYVTTAMLLLGVAIGAPSAAAAPAAIAAAKAAAGTAPPIAKAPANGFADRLKGARLTELDKYVAAPDASFSWKVVSRKQTDAGVELVVDLCSQTWREAGEVDRPQWRHWLTIAVPKSPTSDVALLVIGGGSNHKEPPSGPSEEVRQISQAANSVVAEVSTVPNQPLEIRGDGRQRREDDLIARSWIESIKSFDLTWVAQLPMTKAAVRAMDAVEQTLAAEKLPVVRRFVVTGGSKRGWTSWLTAAVDSRVVGVAPVVIDLLNLRESMRNHHAAYGFWAPSLGDYQSQGLTAFFDSPLSAPLLNLVDPYSYRQRLTMPKCIINASGDEFFTPDSSQFYFDDLSGEKLLAYFPNANHSLDDTQALDTLTAFFWSIVNDKPLPKVSWKLDDKGAWHVTCKTPPQKVKLWHAVNPEARDFRVAKIGKAFTSEVLSPQPSGEYVGGAPQPPKGYAASLIQLEFDVGAPTSLWISTPVHVSPDVRPFAAKPL